MSGWWLPAVSAAAMACQDIVGVLMVQAEASYRAHRAAVCDMAQDACRITSLMIIGNTILIGRDWALSAAVIAATLAADYIGTWSGVRLGERIDRRKEAR